MARKTKEVKRALKLLRKFLYSEESGIARLREALEPAGWIVASSGQASALAWVLGEADPKTKLGFEKKLVDLRAMIENIQAADDQATDDNSESVL
jgi:hypothetical protein